MINKITIVAENPASPAAGFRASWRDRESIGKTAGAALDALTEQMESDAAGTLVLVQSLRPDAFFDAAQQKRIQALLLKRTEAELSGNCLPSSEQAELEQLVLDELLASERRAAQMADESGL